MISNVLSPFSAFANLGIIEIRTASELNSIRNNLDGSYRLMAPIDLSGVDWTPIGTNSAPFTGTLDGNGFAIINLEVVAPMRDLVGLFGRTDGMIINLGLVNANIMGGFTVGSLAGSNRGEIRNCYVAGLSTVFGEGHVGGLVGFNSGTITQSYSASLVHGGGFVGGFSGSNAGDIIRSYSTGTVRTDSSYIGGFVGGMLGEDSTIRNSFTLSNIETNNDEMSAGFIGHIIAGTITNSFSANTNPNGFHHSGSAGYIPFAAHSELITPATQTIVNIESFDVSTAEIEGFSSDVISIFFDSTLANNHTALEGRTTVQMMTRATFTGWDFNTVWDIEEGRSYPFLRGIPRPDETLPIIRDVLPRNNEAIGLNPIFRVLAEDNANLLSVHAEYELNGTWHEINNQFIFTGDSQPIQEFAHRFTWENEAFPHDTVNMRFHAIDLAGNIGNFTYATYDVRNRQPNKPIVTAAPGGMFIDLSITPIPNGITYRLYRIDGVQITLLAEFNASDSLTFTDHHLNPAITYEYFAEVTDTNGNITTGDIIFATPIDYDSYAPVAFAGYDFYAVEGVAIRFDGLASSDNIGIVSYYWEFNDSDGNTATGVTPTHIFEEPGEYDVTLTVTDAAGNTDTKTIKVHVLSTSAASSLVLTVLDDETGEVIEGAAVFAELDESNPSFLSSDFSILTRTDSQGTAYLTSSAYGAHSVAAFAPGYMPRERIFDFVQGGIINGEIRLTRGEVTISGIETRELTLQEIIDAGIDITDPDNRHVFSFDITLVFEGIPLPPMSLTVSGGGNFWRGGGGSGDGGWWGWGGGWGWRGGGGGGTVFPQAIPSPRQDEPPVLVFLNLHGHGHFLKSFFEVTLLQHNQAGSRFPFENNSATISLPDGLSLAPAFGGQRYINVMPDIAGGQSASTSWIVRADEAGVHTITTEFKGHLMPFGEAMSTTFNTTVTVNDSEGLTLIITPQDYAYEGMPYQIDFRLVNNSNAILNALTFDFGGTIIQADTLAPGEFIDGTHDRIFASGTGRDDLYFRLIQMIVNARGINIILNWNAPRYGQLGAGDSWNSIIITRCNDPIDIVNGNLTWDYTDFELHGAQNLNFRRYYNSLCDGTTAAGRGWRHSFEYSLVLGSGGARVTIPNGRDYNFIQNADLTYSLAGTDQPDVTLTQTADGFLFVLFDNTHVLFNASGQAISIADVRGNATTLTYDGTLLTRAENRAGIMHFEYENGFITEIRDNFGRSVFYEYNSNNRPIVFTNADGNTLEFTYDREGNLIEVRNFNGEIYMRNRFISGQVVEQYLPDQGTSFLSYNPIARTTTWTNAVGEIFVFYYDANYQITSVEERFGGMQQVFQGGHLISSTCQMGFTTEYEYDDNGSPILITYPDGTYESFEYNDLRLPTRIIHRDGIEETFEYDARGNLLTWTDRAGNERTFIYDGENNLLSFTDANGETTSFTHDSSGNVTSITDAEGNTTEFEYDNLGRRIIERLPSGEETRFTYTPAGKLLSITDPTGNVTHFETDGNGFVTSMTDPMGNTSFMTFDRQNQPVSVTDHESNRLNRRFDASGRLTHVSDPMGNTTIFDYDGLGRMIRTTDPRGHAWNYSHDASGQLTGITDPYGNEVNLVYDEMGRVTNITNARGAETAFTHDAMGRVTSVVDALGGITETSYDANGNVTSIEDANGSIWTFEYDNENRLTRTTDPLNISATFTYDRLGNLIRTERDGAVHTNSFNSNGRLESSTDPEGNTTHFEYDELGRLIAIENADGTTVSFEYNDSGHLTRTTNEDGNQTTYTTDRNGRVLTITSPMNNTTTFTYDRNGRILTETDALGGITRFSYDRNGNIVTITDALGNITTLTHDRLNRVSTITDPMRGITRFVYDANDNVIAITDAEGYTTEFEYDLLNRLIQTTDQTGGVFTQEYDSVGNLSAQTDALGNTTTFTHDANHRLTRVTDALDEYISFYYDSHDRVIRIVDQEGAETNYVHDRNGRVIRITDALGNATNIEYDEMGRVSRTTDPRGAETNFTYTPTGLLQTVTDALDGITTFEYNALGQLISETNQNGETTSFTRDALGRIITVTNALNHSETFSYDRLGRIVAVTDRNGRTTTYRHDANGNIIEVTDPTGSISTFEYDRLNRLISADVNGGQITLYEYNGRGLLTREVNALGYSRVMVYDANGNLISQTDEDGYVTTFEYNALNLVQRKNYTGGRQANFRYDATGRLVEVTDWTGTTNFSLDVLGRITAVTDNNNRTVNYQYDAAGNQTQVTYPDSTSITRIFDSLNRLTNIQTPEGNFAYSHDPAGRLLSLAYPNGITETYTHDAIGQLLTISQGTEILNQYAYDPNGNVISRTGIENHIPGSVTSNTFNEMNQLTAQTVHNLRGEVTGRFEFTYDQRGNLIQETDNINNTTQTYTFDSSNRIVNGINHQGEESRYLYNSLGTLIRRETIAAAGNFTADFVIDYTSFVPNNLQEYQSDGIIQRHIYGNSLSRISTTLINASNPSQRETFFIQSDRLGSHRFATDSTGTLIAHSLLDEWGAILEQTQVTFNGSQVNILNTFTNHTFDDILGIYYAQARMLCPRNRRFLSPDPHWGPHNLLNNNETLKQFSNLYAYTMNNPLRFIDPTGLHSQDFIRQQSIERNNLSRFTNPTGMPLNTQPPSLAPSRQPQRMQFNAQPPPPATGTGFETLMDTHRSITASEARNRQATTPSTIAQQANNTPSYAPRGLCPENIQTAAINFGTGMGDGFVGHYVGLGNTATTAYQGFRFMAENPFLPFTFFAESPNEIVPAFRATGNLIAEASVEAYVTLSPLSFVRDLNRLQRGYQDDGFYGAGVYTGGQLGQASTALAAMGVGKAVGAAGSAIRKAATSGRATVTGSQTFSPANPGPLPSDAANSFSGATYRQTTLTQDTVFYRVHGGSAREAGRFMTRTPQGGGLQSQIDLALDPSWGNTAQHVTRVVVPRGTVIYEGTAAPQSIFGGAGRLIGGGNQVYIPEVNPSWFGR